METSFEFTSVQHHTCDLRTQFSADSSRKPPHDNACDLIPSHTTLEDATGGNPLFIELCSGCGILSATVGELGFSTLAVDHKHNRRQTKTRTFDLDLSHSHSWQVMRHIVKNCAMAAVHIAPPCGTCSRAREIAMDEHQHGPPPLRDHDHPYGVPWMTSRERERVDTANSLYMHMSQFLARATSLRSIPANMEG